MEENAGCLHLGHWRPQFIKLNEELEQCHGNCNRRRSLEPPTLITVSVSPSSAEVQGSVVAACQHTEQLFSCRDAGRKCCQTVESDLQALMYDSHLIDEQLKSAFSPDLPCSSRSTITAVPNFLDYNCQM
ncbi:hypothetical protein E1301_Tti014144 [Triplophysa tibetana]|uniref:Uncharacterized protein n=1 Tax=Triplophysa tibetana TaxID=1572043 RepID=A0A5A9PS10_9TELE|nr:hypothetical protein E1301_Tti014144 [Triplophysa tibetana]